MAVSFSATVARIIRQHGEVMQLVREAEATRVTMQGKVILSLDMDEIGGTAAQQTFRVKIAAKEIGASSWAIKEPLRKDVLDIDSRRYVVIDARPFYDQDSVVLYELTVVG